MQASDPIQNPLARENSRFHRSPDASVCVVMSSEGYPGTFEAGKRISGLEQAEKMEGIKIFHAGTNKRDGIYYTSGGRVFGFTSRAADLATAVKRVYDGVSVIKFECSYYRKDIAARALAKK